MIISWKNYNEIDRISEHETSHTVLVDPVAQTELQPIVSQKMPRLIGHHATTAVIRDRLLNQMKHEK